MNLISYIVIDDEPLAREGVRIQCDKISYLQFKGEFSSPIEALQTLDNESIDLVFLDIEMPEISGLDFLRNTNTDALVILTTAYPQYALEAFELDVVDYIVKPIRFDRFLKAVNKVRDVIHLKSKEQSDLDISDEHIFVKSERRYIKLFLNEILFIKGLKDYVIIHTENEKYMTAMNVKTVLSKLPSSIFARVSKSFIINVNHISSIEQDMIWIGKEDIPLGNTYKALFIDTYIKKKLIDRN